MHVPPFLIYTLLVNCHPERSVRLPFRPPVFAGRADAQSKDLRLRFALFCESALYQGRLQPVL